MGNPLARFFLVFAVIGGVLGTLFYAFEQRIAQGDAQSLCTDLAMIQFDQRHGASYATDTLIAGYQADLKQLGYSCVNGKATKITTTEIAVTNDMSPKATNPTCTADGSLVLPPVGLTTWKLVVNGALYPAHNNAGPGTYHVRLVPDDGYTLSTAIDQTVTVKRKLTGAACKNGSSPKGNTTYECRTSGLNSGPTYEVFQPGKLGPYDYGAPFTARTIVEARKSIHDQAWCDPVWMVQKYREYVDHGMTADQANAKVHELIAQAKAGKEAQWDKMVGEIMAAFDKATNSFTTIPAGTYNSLGVLTNTSDGVPRIVNFVVDRQGTTAVLQSVVTYRDGTKATLWLRLACDLQLQAPLAVKPTAPTMAKIPRTSEGSPAKAKSVTVVVHKTVTVVATATATATATSTTTKIAAPTCTWPNGQVVNRWPNGTCPKYTGEAYRTHLEGSAPSAGRETPAVTRTPGSTYTPAPAPAPATTTRSVSPSPVQASAPTSTAPALPSSTATPNPGVWGSTKP